MPSLIPCPCPQKQKRSTMLPSSTTPRAALIQADNSGQHVCPDRLARELHTRPHAGRYRGWGRTRHVTLQPAVCQEMSLAGPRAPMYRTRMYHDRVVCTPSQSHELKSIPATMAAAPAKTHCAILSADHTLRYCEVRWSNLAHLHAALPWVDDSVTSSASTYVSTLVPPIAVWHVAVAFGHTPPGNCFVRGISMSGVKEHLTQIATPERAGGATLVRRHLHLGPPIVSQTRCDTGRKIGYSRPQRSRPRPVD